MALTLDIPSDLQAQIEHAAALRGTDAQAFVIEATRRALQDTKTVPATRSFGFLKERIASSDKFLLSKHNQT